MRIGKILIISFILSFSGFLIGNVIPNNEMYEKFRKELLQNNINKNNFINKQDKNNNLYYFISFSMRDEAINLVMVEAKKFNIPVYINGLVNNSMKDTSDKFIELFGSDKAYGIAIDPTRFDQFNIKNIPVLVVECDVGIDKISGNIPISQALEKISEEGDCKHLAKKALQE